MTPNDTPLAEGLRFGPLGENWVHLCIDMQRLFAARTEWHTPWITRTLPNVVAVAELDPSRTIFTRFIPPRHAEEMGGAWHRYYRRWASMTREQLDPDLLELLPELSRLVPPGLIEDKPVMSCWFGNLHSRLTTAGVDTIIVSGAESEVCVLAAVMGAIDLGYRVVVVSDAVCSSADTTHDAVLHIYRSRFGMQVETIATAELLAARIDRML